MKIKTKKDTIAKPLTFFILLGVLKGYISNTLFFIVLSKLSFKKYLKTITIDLPQNFIKEYGFIVWLYLRLTKGKSF